jgi:hypothetical protein
MLVQRSCWKLLEARTRAICGILDVPKLAAFRIAQLGNDLRSGEARGICMVWRE